MRLVWTMIAVACLATGSAASGGKLDSHPWRKFGPGAWTRTEIADTRGPSLFATDKLLKTSKTRYYLETVNEMEGLEAWTVERDFDYAFFGYAHLSPGTKVDEFEVLTIMGTRVRAGIHERGWSDGDSSSLVRTWVAKGVPVPVRFTMESSGNQLDMWLAGRHDPIAVGTERIECARYEGIFVDDQGTVFESMQWRSDEVPGGIVLTETRSRPQDGGWTHTAKLVDFGVDAAER